MILRGLRLALSRVAVGILFCSLAHADGLVPDRVNKVAIGGQFSQKTPSFLLVFSAAPLANARGRLAEALTGGQFGELKSNEQRVVIRVGGKTANKQGHFEYFFGNKQDEAMPWNNGKEFSASDWSKYSPDVWDNLAIVFIPTSARKQSGFVSEVVVRRGDQLLFDSRKKNSYPNRQRIDVGLSRRNLVRRGGYVVLNLSSAMRRFRRSYYEIGDNPILKSAYDDLGQTDKSKYCNRGRNWCSEFASWLYRENQIETPDPNAGDVWAGNMFEFFKKNGDVYTAREVMSWSDSKKRRLIRPGTFISIAYGDALSTHSLIFTTWIRNEQGGIKRYASISGNNRGMVWAHAPAKLPTADQFKGKSSKWLQEYDSKVFFAVPRK